MNQWKGNEESREHKRHDGTPDLGGAGSRLNCRHGCHAKVKATRKSKVRCVPTVRGGIQLPPTALADVACLETNVLLCSRMALYPACIRMTSNARPRLPVAEVNRLKAEGNERLSSGDYNGAVDYYTRALAIDAAGPQSHILHSNRAAAYTKLDQHENALQDARSVRHRECCPDTCLLSSPL
jgi:hypothetical protein